jgi:hypothetical protein
MEYAKTYLGKPLAELSYADIEVFFSHEREETDQIEFKSFHDKSTEEATYRGLIQSIAAFLNSGGGLLIWGAPVGTVVHGRKEKVFKGDLTNVPLTIEKDWLISKIVDKIIPLPIGLRVRLVPSPVRTGQVAVFEVDESIYSPHQTGHTYLMRVDGQTKPAPHHYVEALFKRVSFPRLEGYISPRSTTSVPGGYLVTIDFIIVNFSPFLNEESLYYRISLVGGVFDGQKGSPNYRPASTYGGPASDIIDRGVNGNELRSTSSNLALFNGEPYRFKRTMFFLDSLIRRKNDIGIVTFLFGGKSAPMKCCQYIIDFSEMSSGKTTYTVDFQNKLMSQLQQENEHSEADILQQLNVLN